MKHHSSRNRDDYVVNKGELLEVNAKDAPVKDIKWEAEELEVHSDPIKDPGTGHPVLLRVFEYSLNPTVPKNVSKQAIFDSHKQQIKMLLWADGLSPLEDIKKPKVEISKKQNKYRIFVLCTPKEVLLDKPTIIK